MNLAVLGASGYVGGRLVARLLGAGHSVTLIAREAAPLADRFPAARVVSGDALVPGSLADGLRGIETLYYLVYAASRGAGSRAARTAGADGATERDLRAARNVAAAAAEAGVARIIHLAGLDADRGSGQAITSGPGLGEGSIGGALAGTGIPVTEFRTAVIIGSGSASFEIVRHLTERLPVMLTPRWVETNCQPIGIGNVLDYLVEVLDRPEVQGVVEIGGPDVLSTREMMLIYARVRGLRRLIVRVPVVAPGLSARWLGLVTPVPAWIARPLVERLRDELVVRDPGPAAAFAVRPIGVEAALRRALDRTIGNEVESTWFDAYSVSHHGRAAPPLELGEGMLIDRRSTTVEAPRELVFAEVEGVGGSNGWPFADTLWRIRGLVDRLTGGVGMRLGRRDPTRVRVGDALDFWRVEAIRRPELLRLRAEMRTPGRAWLQYEVEESPGGSRLVQTAFFEPRGLGGFAYWYALLPIHVVIFRGMVTTLAARSGERAKVTNVTTRDPEPGE
ncbi:MAG TPA: SDR family oxidoreductase [Candidatus Sulfomarinibacteraceae bacterium]|nr:SDR family oxidoreductase [Candidatus Sulfomarinibacteraceae bacterium]